MAPNEANCRSRERLCNRARWTASALTCSPCLSPFRTGKPKWGAMEITEPQAGSDAANIQTTAVLDDDTIFIGDGGDFGR